VTIRSWVMIHSVPQFAVILPSLCSAQSCPGESDDIIPMIDYRKTSGLITAWLHKVHMVYKTRDTKSNSNDRAYINCYHIQQLKMLQFKRSCNCSCMIIMNIMNMEIIDISNTIQVQEFSANLQNSSIFFSILCKFDFLFIF